MGEIKMNDPDLREIASALRYLEGREDECSSNRRKWGEIAASIEEQVKPAIEEPTEFGSLVRAICGLSVTGNLWQMSPGDGSHYWTDAHGCAVVWSELKDPEVLRVGIGEPANQVSDRASASTSAPHASDLRQEIMQRLRQLRSEAITSERKSAYDIALLTVEELQP